MMCTNARAASEWSSAFTDRKPIPFAPRLAAMAPARTVGRRAPVGDYARGWACGGSAATGDVPPSDGPRRATSSTAQATKPAARKPV